MLFFVFFSLLLLSKPLFADWEFDAINLWHYVGTNGEFVKNSIVRKDGLRFYLDDTGHILKGSLLNIGDNTTYYCNYFGALASNCWVKVDSDDVEEKIDPVPEYYYYYFDENGKAIKGANGRPRFFRLDGKTYLFNEYGQLLVGWIREDGTVVDPEENQHPYEEALYYSNNDGELVSGWLMIENSYIDEKAVNETKNLWFYFQPGTFKKKGYNKVEAKDISGKHYLFSDKGYLYVDFAAYNEDNLRREEFFGEKKGGNKYKGQWAYTVPPEDGTYTEEEKKEKHWMFFERSGKPIKNEVRKINGEYYAFSENGIMQSGIVAFLNGRILFIADMDETSAEDIVKKGKYTYRKNGQKYYFYDTVGYELETPFYMSSCDIIDPSIDYRLIWFGTLSKEINTLRNMENTGRYAELYDMMYGFALYNPNIKYLYFTDNGAMVNGKEKVHFNDGEYYFGSNIGGHYKDSRNNKYYYEGIELRADKEIGYGIFVVERSLPQTMQKNVYDLIFAPLSYCDVATIPEKFMHYYEKINDNESIYKLLDPNGKIVKGRAKAYKDKQGRYWYVEPNGDWFYGIFDTEVKKGKSKLLNMRTKIDKNSCPEILKTGTLQEKIDYLMTFDYSSDKYNIALLFDDDFKDSYTFARAGKITDISFKEVKGDPSKLEFSIKYNGMLYKSMYGSSNTYIPFGMSDENGYTASFFHETNDFEIIPDDNDFFVNACWDDDDSIDWMCMFDSDGVRNVDWFTPYR